MPSAQFPEHKLSVEVLLVTPALAHKWLDEHNYSGQRNRKAKHVARLTAAIQGGRFRTITTVIQFVGLDDQWHLVDGQHSLDAVIHSGMSIPLFIMRQRVETIEELRQIYGTFNRDLPRQPHEVLGGLGLASRLHMAPTDVDFYYRAMKWVLGDFAIPSQANDIIIASDVAFVAEAMTTARWLAAAKEAFDVVATATPYLRRPLQRPEALAVMLATLTADVADLPKARGIWQTVAADDGLRQGDPRKALVNFLLERGHAGERRSVLTRLRSIAGTYNAAYRGRTLRNPVPSFQGMVGLSLDGTEFRARRLAATQQPPPVKQQPATPARRSAP
jgi:hypothetical protein